MTRTTELVLVLAAFMASCSTGQGDEDPRHSGRSSRTTAPRNNTSGSKSISNHSSSETPQVSSTTSSESHSGSTEVLARVNGREITANDVDLAMKKGKWLQPRGISTDESRRKARR